MHVFTDDFFHVFPGLSGANPYSKFAWEDPSAPPLPPQPVTDNDLSHGCESKRNLRIHVYYK